MNADLISRKALIEAVEKQRLYVTNYTTAESIVRAQGRLFRKAVDEAPAVEAVLVVHGRWRRFINGDGEYKYLCEVCEEIVTYEMGGSNYCPNCGAKMDGGKDT